MKWVCSEYRKTFPLFSIFKEIICHVLCNDIAIKIAERVSHVSVSPLLLVVTIDTTDFFSLNMFALFTTIYWTSYGITPLLRLDGRRCHSKCRFLRKLQTSDKFRIKDCERKWIKCQNCRKGRRNARGITMNWYAKTADIPSPQATYQGQYTFADWRVLVLLTKVSRECSR